MSPLRGEDSLCPARRALTRTPNVTLRLRRWDSLELRLQLPICLREVRTGFLEAAQITRPIFADCYFIPAGQLAPIHLLLPA